MPAHRKILPALLLLCTPATAQIDTTLRSFYPLQIGNYWEYQDEDFPEPTIRFSITIVRDTTMPNGKTYRRLVSRVIPSGETTPFFARMNDSLRVYGFIRGGDIRCPTSEYLRFDLTVRDRTLWPVCLDRIPDGQDYLSLVWTRRYFAPLLSLDSLTKFFTSATIDTASGDTLWGAGLQYGYGNIWLAKGIGVVRSQGEASLPVNLVGAIINGTRYGTISSIKEDSASTSERLLQNYPNPFNSMTKIRYDLSHRGYASLVVYDQLGREIAIIADGWHEAGSYSVVFDAPMSLSTGIYYCALKTAQKTTYNKMIIVK